MKSLCLKLLSNPAVIKCMWKKLKGYFQNKYLPIPGNECIKDTWGLHMPFSLSVYQAIDC